MVVEHTIDTFESNPHIHEIAIVSNPFYISDFESIIIKNGWKKVKKILKGGQERYHSSLSAIKAYEDTDVNLIFHDAVRPLVSQRILNDVIAALETYKAIDVAMPATETIKHAYDIALQDPAFKVTDDCGVVVKYLPEVPVYVVNGEESNMKLTYKEDTYLLDKFFQLRKSELNTLPIDQENNLKNRVAVVFGGSYGIGADVAQLLKEKGANVFCYSRSMNGTDVGNKEQVSKALQEVYRQCGRIDYIINTAGLLNKEPLMSCDYQTICNAVNTNYMGTVNVALEAFPYLKESKGKLVFFTSSSYTRGRAFYSIYSSTKAAIVNFVQAIAQEWEPFGISVNCINPERTKTPMRVHNFGIEPDNTLLTSEQVAITTIQSLLSEFTGQVIDVKREEV